MPTTNMRRERWWCCGDFSGVIKRLSIRVLIDERGRLVARVVRKVRLLSLQLKKRSIGRSGGRRQMLFNYDPSSYWKNFDDGRLQLEEMELFGRSIAHNSFVA
ncbi:hypothetical protein Scep_000065 [Stephania cephalantha]|uniref:Uncharacterized protein n=1 Tax=Stephania cephalantha TaxID=152367 RepID=A0AAP0Q3S5_9MAGN